MLLIARISWYASSHSVTYEVCLDWPIIPEVDFFERCIVCSNFMSGETALKLPVLVLTTNFPVINSLYISG